MFSSNTSQQSEGYQIQRSLRFNSADSAYLNRTPASAGNRKTWTWSGWVKRSALGARQGLMVTTNAGATDYFVFEFDAYDRFFVQGRRTADSLSSIVLPTVAVYRDTSAWYHVVLSFDTTQATASDRVKAYINGVQATFNSTEPNFAYPAQNTEYRVNTTNSHAIGSFDLLNILYFNGYMTEVNFIDGQALTPSSFGQTNANTGVWEPKPYAGTYGTNGFYLNFSDNSNTTATTLGKDYSGNGNNWTPNNFSVSAGAGNDSLVDVPTAWGTDTGVGGTVRGNYATFNPLFVESGSATYTNGNLGTTVTGAKARSTIGIPLNSKIYAEVVCTSIPNFTWIGVTNGSDEQVIASGNFGLNEYAANDVIGLAIDTSANTLAFYKNGTLFVPPRTISLTPGTTYFVAVYGQASTPFIANFGQRPFAYTAPSGFKALCTQSLPTPTIGSTTATQANRYFDVVLRTSAGTSGSSVTSLNFQPDFVWDKPRSSAGDHYLEDAVRGVGKFLNTNNTSAEGTNNSFITAFTSNGFTIGSADWGAGTTVVDWAWKANGAGVTNTAGSIASTVSANTTSGFSVVTYTGNGVGGATVGHGLGAAPKMMIIKRRSTTAAWVVYHASLGATQGIYLNLTDSAYTGSTFWNNTSPGSSVFTIGTVSENNVNGSTYVAYCFAEVPGFSKFGSYTGNGSADGPFVYCGFRPAYVLIKSSNLTWNWFVFDEARSTYNAANSVLLPNSTSSEITGSNYVIDMLSNGFKIRTTDAQFNGSSSDTYIFAAFAEAPQKFALAR